MTKRKEPEELTRKKRAIIRGKVKLKGPMPKRVLERKSKLVIKENVHYRKIPVTQAERVVARFGGVENLLRALEGIGKKRNKTSVYRWMWPSEKSGGTGGIIPTSALIDVICAARAEGVLLSAQDLDPRISFMNVKNEKKDEDDVNKDED